MRRVRYNVAVSLDGYIADPRGGFDWIPNDPAVNFAEVFAKVDTVLLGRRSYEVAVASGPLPWEPGTRVYVFSRTLQQEAHPGVTIVAQDAGRVVSELRHEQGEGDIWLFGGGDLCRTLIAEGQVDSVEVTTVPVLLGGGVPLLPDGVERTPLVLEGVRVYPSGMVSLLYAVRR